VALAPDHGAAGYRIVDSGRQMSLTERSLRAGRRSHGQDQGRRIGVNPNADEVEGDACYHDLKSIPGGVDAVVIATRSETAEATMRECDELGITHVWMHRSFGAGSVSKAAADYGRQHGIKVIDGGCPLMFAPTADTGHRVMRMVCTLAGAVPRRV
jgi:uncharacterized protein